MSCKAEVWRPIVGYERLYEVSSRGRVRALEKIDGSGSKRKAKVLCPIANSRKRWNSAHYHVGLVKPGEAKKRYFIHRLVAEAFLPNPAGKPFVNHIDGNKWNNDARNLEWVTEEENRTHAYANGLTSRGENSGRARLTDDLVLSLRYLYNCGVSISVLAAAFGFGELHMSKVVRGKSWKHLPLNQPIKHHRTLKAFLT